MLSTGPPSRCVAGDCREQGAGLKPSAKSSACKAVHPKHDAGHAEQAGEHARELHGEDAGADFIRITVFGRQAETCDRYLAKGRQVAVQGRIQTGSYKNREGVTVYTTDVVADRVEFLGGGQGGQNNGGQGGYQGGGSYQGGNNYGPANNSGFGGQDTGFGGSQERGGSSQSSGLFDGFDDLPDTFQAAEDDIPF